MNNQIISLVLFISVFVCVVEGNWNSTIRGIDSRFVSSAINKCSKQEFIGLPEDCTGTLGKRVAILDNRFVKFGNTFCF